MQGIFRRCGCVMRYGLTENLGKWDRRAGLCKFLEHYSRLKGEELGIRFSTIVSPCALFRFLLK